MEGRQDEYRARRLLWAFRQERLAVYSRGMNEEVQIGQKKLFRRQTQQDLD